MLGVLLLAVPQLYGVGYPVMYAAVAGCAVVSGDPRRGQNAGLQPDHRGADGSPVLTLGAEHQSTHRRTSVPATRLLVVVVVTVVGNDTGGALCQILCANHPELVGRLVLTNCDAFEHFPPRAFRPIEAAGAYVPGLVADLDLLLRARSVRRTLLAAAPLTIQPLPDELLADWFAPLRDRRIRIDLRTVLQGISAKHTLAAAERLRSFDRPTLIAWGTRDRFFRCVMPNDSLKYCPAHAWKKSKMPGLTFNSINRSGSPTCCWSMWVSRCGL